MREHRDGEREDVLGDDEVPPLDERPRLREAQERDPRPRAAAECEPIAGAGVAQQPDDEAVERLLDVDATGGADRGDELCVAGDRLELVERRLGRLFGEHPRLVSLLRVPDRHPHREPVELRLRQRVGAFVLDGVLRRETRNGRGEQVRVAVDGDLALLHRLEQRRLRLGRRAVDLVDEHDVREDGARAEAEDARSAGRRRSRR